MYCGQCGKKVMDTMLFCPFCGSPIVIPDQDDDLAERPAPAERLAPAQPAAEEIPAEPKQPECPAAPEAERKKAAPISLFDIPLDAEEPKEQFVPLSFDLEEAEEAAPAEKTAVEVVDIPEEVPEEESAPARRAAPQAKPPQNRRKRPANTYIPVKEIDPDDIFMDNDDDEYDLDDDIDDEDEDFYYEEQDEGSFFQRHIRGFVGLLLFLLLIAICALWANTAQGQMTLARFNLAWRPEPYAELGYAAYQADNDLMAARYYEKALARDEDNYEYAHSAMVAYYEAEQLESSAAMLKVCVSMDPDNPEPYQEMMILYPDAATRPWEIKELIRKGYELTGDESLRQ